MLSVSGSTGMIRRKVHFTFIETIVPIVLGETTIRDNAGGSVHNSVSSSTMFMFLARQ